MSLLVDTQCHAILYAALGAELGIVLRTNNPVKARATLYTARRTLGDTELANLQIRVSPNDSEHEIWIIRKDNIPSVDLSLV
jgi:hypothetical protein